LTVRRDHLKLNNYAPQWINMPKPGITKIRSCRNRQIAKRKKALGRG
jgi:hypothetical protein